MGVRPLIVLHQCADPVWFVKKGGWEKPDNLRCFVIYVEHVLRAIGHLANEYITFARPNSYVFNGWLYGLWPPGKKSMKAATAAMSGICGAHIRAYRLIHDVRRELGFFDTRVSFALEYRVFVPRSRINPLHRAAAAEMERVYQALPAVAMLTGEFRAPLKCPGKDRRGTFADFHAIDYDTRSAVAGMHESTLPDVFRDDLGREIWPEGVFQASRKLLKMRPMNIYLTCGACDVNDSFRSRFLYDALKLVCESKLPVKRWYYDGFLDGFNWLDGCYARCGLVGVDFETMERSVKRSGEFYSKIIRHGGVTEKLYEKYVAEATYHL
jgi:beta-glucosidase